MKAFVRATVYYTCELTDEDAEKVRKYAEEHDCELEEAVRALYFNSIEEESINLYQCSEESDFDTECIEEVWED